MGRFSSPSIAKNSSEGERERQLIKAEKEGASLKDKVDKISYWRPIFQFHIFTATIKK